jgi:hypothetical protein
VDPPTNPSVLLRLLWAAGYRLSEAGGVSLAVRPADHRAVLLAPPGRSPADLEGLFPLTAVHRTVVYGEEPGEAARELASAHGLELLDLTNLGPALGELLLPSALVPGNGAALAEEEGGLNAPFPPVAAGPSIVRPRIDRREAQALAGLPGARYTLRLVPFYVASYRVRMAGPGVGPPRVYRRLVAVNATSRRAETWPEGDRELVAEVDGPAERLAPQLAEPGAVPLAMEAIRRDHTVRVDHTEQHAGAIVVESRRVPPPPDDIRLGPFSLLFVPYWYAETANGRRVLDAVSGRGPASADAPGDRERSPRP